MLENLQFELTLFIKLAKKNMPFVLQGLGILWGFNILNWVVFGSRLNRFGLIPRTPRGLIGIFSSTFLHANFNHLFFNSIPLFALSLMLLTFGTKVFIYVSVIIIAIENIAIWLIGRKANHIGASGLISGYFAFLLAIAYKKPDIISVFLAFIALYYFGSILLSLIPKNDKTSYEGHIFGFIAGICAMLYCTKQYLI